MLECCVLASWYLTKLAPNFNLFVVLYKALKRQMYTLGREGLGQLLSMQRGLGSSVTGLPLALRLRVAQEPVLNGCVTSLSRVEKGEAPVVRDLEVRLPEV